MLGIYLNIKLNNFLGVILFPMYGTVVTVNFWRLLPLHDPTMHPPTPNTHRRTHIKHGCAHYMNYDHKFIFARLADTGQHLQGMCLLRV